MSLVFTFANTANYRQMFFAQVFSLSHAQYTHYTLCSKHTSDSDLSNCKKEYF